jgi:NitT/TauT family transport system substrate-binding protein
MSACPVFRRPAIGAAVAAALLVAGCGSAGGSAAPPSVEKPNLVVGAVPAIDTAGLYIAQQRGLFAAQGLHVTIEPEISSKTVIDGQMAGKFDVTLGAYVSYMLADAQQGDDLMVLAEGSVMQPRTQVVVVPAGSKIKTPADLKGKTVAVNVVGNIASLLVNSALTDNAMTPSEVNFVPIPFPFMVAALQKHQVDAAEMPEPFATAAQVTIGAQVLFDTDQGATQNLPITGYVVTRTWAKKYPKTAAAFLRALLEGQTIADTDRTAVEQVIVQYTHVPPSSAALIATNSYPLGVDRTRLQRVADLMLRFGLLKRPFNVAPMIP